MNNNKQIVSNNNPQIGSNNEAGLNQQKIQVQFDQIKYFCDNENKQLIKQQDKQQGILSQNQVKKQSQQTYQNKHINNYEVYQRNQTEKMNINNQQDDKNNNINIKIQLNNNNVDNNQNGNKIVSESHQQYQQINNKQTNISNQQANSLTLNQHNNNNNIAYQTSKYSNYQNKQQNPNNKNILLAQNTNETNENQPHIIQNIQDSIKSQTTYPASSLQKQRYNSYVNGLVNSNFGASSQPSHQELEQLYNALGKQFPNCSAKQIILLLYNNLIKIPREEELMQQEFNNDQNADKKQIYLNQNQQTNSNLLYDGSNYIKSLKGQPQLDTFTQRRKMVYVYTTKGYGVKVYQQYMQKKNPSQPIMNKQQFKAHFVNIYKVIIKKIQQFLINICDRQFQPMNRQQFQKTLGDVINCRKYFSAQFCELFFKILKCTFDLKVQKVPNQKQIMNFYRTILSKVRQGNIIFPKKSLNIQQQKDTDIWSQQFQNYVITLYIKYRNINQVKNVIFQNYPEYSQFLDEIKLKNKIQNAIRLATRWVQIQNQKSGNNILFLPTDIDRKFIMSSPEFQQSRIKLLKVFVKKVNDANVLAQVVTFILNNLKQKYAKEGIPQKILKQSNFIYNEQSLVNQQQQLIKMIKYQIKNESQKQPQQLVSVSQHF